MKNPNNSLRLAAPMQRRFGYRFSMVSAALAQHMLRYVQREHGLNIAEYRVMTNLVAFDAPSTRDIAKHSQLDKAHVTRALAALIERGLASQVVDVHDRRLRVVRLTAAGRAVMNAIEPFVTKRQERLESCLAPNELRVLDKALSLLSAESERLLAEIEATPPRRPIENLKPELRQGRRNSRATGRI